MSKTISTLFTNTSVPAEGLTPTIRIWEVDPAGDTLVVIDASMDEVGDGFYKYVFTTYDPRKEYLFRTFGGVSLPIGERYQSASNKHDAQEVWGGAVTDHLIAGSFGEAINTININVNTAITVLDLLLKFETNRTRVDPVANTLTIYDDDGTSILHVFDLFDETGASSSDCVYERRPV